MALKDTAIDSRILTYGLVAAGLYVVYQLVQGAKAVVHGVGSAASAVGAVVGETTSAAGNAIGSGLYTLFNPSTDQLGSGLYYIVNFPDGSRHAINSTLVDQGTGLFNWSGYPTGSQPEYTYQLAKDAGGAWQAVG